MSSDSDRVAFDESVSAQDNTVLFQSKKWSYITDSSSNGGVFNGQLQFDLNTLSSQNQWTDLSQAYIQFPVKLSIKSTSAIASGAQAFGNFSATIANGFHQFIDSTQITIGGTTIQASQIHENINATFKILTEWSGDELKKNGPTLGVALDDYQLAADSALSTREGLDNIGLATTVNSMPPLSPAFAGVQYPVNRNTGFKERAQYLNSSTDNTLVATAILGSNASTLGKGRVSSNTLTAAVSAGDDVFVAFYMATVRLKDISDAISKFPCVKGLKGFIYVNYNAANITFNAATSGLPTARPTAQALYGRTMPALLNTTAAGFAATDLSFTAEINGNASLTDAVKAAVPAFNNARLFAPYYVANPDVDRALTMSKTIRYHERYTTSFTMPATGSFSGTLSPGITNPKRVILLPLLTQAGTNAESNTAGLKSFAVNPLLSPWDPAGKGASSPFAALSQLQLVVGGVPMWQQPLTMDYESFCQELTQTGLDGGLVSQTNSGLLNQRLWNQMYRYYTCDVSRRMGSEDGSSKSITCNVNNPCAAPMTVIVHIWYEKEIKIDTAMGTITQGL